MGGNANKNQKYNKQFHLIESNGWEGREEIFKLVGFFQTSEEIQSKSVSGMSEKNLCEIFLLLKKVPEENRNDECTF